MEAPSNNEDYNNDPNDGGASAHHKISQSNYGRMRQGDRLGVSSNLAATDLSKDQLNKLEIEKQVQLKKTNTMIPKKQIHKYQNEPYSTKQIKDLGGC